MRFLERQLLVKSLKLAVVLSLLTLVSLSLSLYLLACLSFSCRSCSRSIFIRVLCVLASHLLPVLWICPLLAQSPGLLWCGSLAVFWWRSPVKTLLHRRQDESCLPSTLHAGCWSSASPLLSRQGFSSLPFCLFKEQGRRWRLGHTSCGEPSPSKEELGGCEGCPNPQSGVRHAIGCGTWENHKAIDYGWCRNCSYGTAIPLACFIPNNSGNPLAYREQDRPGLILRTVPDMAPALSVWAWTFPSSNCDG